MGSSFHPLDLELVSPLDTEAITSSLATGRDHTLSSNQINSKHSLNTRDFPAVSVETAPFINNSRPIPKQKSTSSTHSKGLSSSPKFPSHLSTSKPTLRGSRLSLTTNITSNTTAVSPASSPTSATADKMSMDANKMNKPPIKSSTPSLQKSIGECIKGFFNKSNVNLHRNVNDTPWEVPFPNPGDPKHGLVAKHLNYLRTTKYTIFSFVPVVLLQQFRRFYNFYFLVAALLAAFTRNSSISWQTQVLPLVFVICAAAIKEAIEDYGRYKADKEANNIQYDITRAGESMTLLSMHIAPGDILYLKKGQKLPVDAIALSTSFGEEGTCYIETAELDGETNLKRRSAISATSTFTERKEISGLKGSMQCEHPNEDLTTFEGRIHFASPLNMTLPLSMTQFLPRGAVVRNTEFVWAVVIYTGRNTKIFKNLKPAGLKDSTMERRLNKIVIAAFVYNAIILLMSTLFEYVDYLNWISYQNNHPNSITAAQWWLYPTGLPTSGSQNALDSFISFFSLYTYVIPISLFVTMEVVRLIQGEFMHWDHKMMCIREDPIGSGKMVKVRMKANNTNLNEELGDIEYIFSDKTGTLTQNSMRIHSWFVNGDLINEMEDPGALGKKIKEQRRISDVKDPYLRFAQSIVLCNTVIPAHEDDGSLIYESQSPDEAALLNGMRPNRILLTGRTKKDITISVFGEDEVYESLALLDFTSDRKRMSAIVRTAKGKIHLYCKGADNVIFSRLSPDPSINPPVLLAEAQAALDSLSETGLRTLAVAYRVLTETEWMEFKVTYDEAQLSLKDRENAVSEACERVEKNLTLIGCTAIEDRLQDEVPETIEYLLASDIHIWLLTGDKLETAINIGQSSSLILPDMGVLILNGRSEQDLTKGFAKIIEEIAAQKIGKRNSLVVTGDCLAQIFTLPGKDKEFLSIATRCHSVICCRVTPLQKALVVKLVRKELKKVTLAIGDGANDVSMIQAAHVGVGIMGREGNQAARASDYSFAEFRFLKRLLAVHGRWSYLRLSKFIFYSFYKNLAFITVQWLYGFLSGQSGENVYEEIFLAAWNIIYTSLPPIALSLFEVDVVSQRIEFCPQLYKQVKDGEYWNFKTIVGWVTSALWHGAIVFWFVYAIRFEGSLATDGRVSGQWVQSYYFATCILLTALCKIALATRYWVVFSFLAIICSLLLHIITMFSLQALGPSWLEEGTTTILYVEPSYWFAMLLVPVSALIPDVAVMYIKRTYFPSDADIIAEDCRIHPPPPPTTRNNSIQMVKIESGHAIMSHSSPSYAPISYTNLDATTVPNTNLPHRLP